MSLPIPHCGDSNYPDALRAAMREIAREEINEWVANSNETRTHACRVIAREEIRAASQPMQTAPPWAGLNPSKIEGMAPASEVQRARYEALEEAARGVEKEISFRKLAACGHCHGSGAEPGSKRVPCPTCRGAGQVTEELLPE